MKKRTQKSRSDKQMIEAKADPPRKKRAIFGDIPIVQDGSMLHDGGVDARPEAQSVFGNLKASLATLERLFEVYGRWEYEDGVYRFYHQSFKVYRLQNATLEIVAALQGLSPDRKLNDWFMQIVADGTSKEFEDEHNERWLAVTRPIVEAFLHARYFLEMAVRYGKELEAPPMALPSGWAAFLYLYGLR
jgi:hypothetical protein